MPNSYTIITSLGAELKVASTATGEPWTNLAVPLVKYLWTSGSSSLIGEDIRASDIYINRTGPDGDSFLYFYEGGSSQGAYLSWDNTATEFVFNHPLSMGTDQIHDVVDPTEAQDAATKACVDTGVAQSVTLYPHTRLGDFTWNSTDEFLQSSISSEASTDTCYIYLPYFEGCGTINVRTYQSVSGTDNTLTTTAAFQYITDGAAWTTIASDNNVVTTDGGDETTTLAITGFSAGYTVSRQYRLLITTTTFNAAGLGITYIYGTNLAI